MSLLGHPEVTIPSQAHRDPPVGGKPTAGGGPTEAHGCPRGRDAVHLLVYNDSQTPNSSDGPGWTLVAWAGTARRWSAALAPHGAGALIGPRVAKAAPRCVS